MAAQGVPVKVIAEILGHSDVRLTQNVYQHVYREGKAEAAAKMDVLLARISTMERVATTVATNTLSGKPN